MDSPTRTEIEQHIRTVAAISKLDPDLAVRQCAAESSFNPSAVSHCGAIGLFQLMPTTAQSLGVDPHDWKQNVAGWSDYMCQLRRQFGGDYSQMLASYNWGAGNVRRALIEHGNDWKQHLPAETRGYLKKILGGV